MTAQRDEGRPAAERSMRRLVGLGRQVQRARSQLRALPMSAAASSGSVLRAGAVIIVAIGTRLLNANAA